MTVGIVSDTHGWFHPELPRVFSEVDHILHAGDIGNEEVLDSFERIAPTSAVFGNVDGTKIRNRCPEVLDIVLDGCRVVMMHIAGRPGKLRSEATAEIVRAKPAIFVCGHSHILQIERMKSHDGVLFVNPGAAGRQGLHRVKTCIRLSLKNGKPDKAEVVHLDEESNAS